jgi:hypothetical protein
MTEATLVPVIGNVPLPHSGHPSNTIRQARCK